MAQFSVTDSIDPLLRVELAPHEEINAERNAMVSMDGSLSLIGSPKGGIFKALARKFFNSESFFQQRIRAEDQAGSVLLAPMLPGAVRTLDIGNRQYLLNDGAYLASESSVELELTSQSLWKTFFADNGGFFLMQTSGHGKLAIAGFGSLSEITLDGTQPVLIDNGHLVAWDNQLKYEVAFRTSRRSLISTIFHSQTTGEGVVLRFEGQGKLYVSSRNRENLIELVAQRVIPQDDKQQ